ncbi:MAG: O-antigen ligase family protein [Oscillibacter sp.]|nr:O-antigen ligase family protein [Oscillibacter sp.]
MTLWKESLLYSLYVTVLAAYEQSAARRILYAFGGWCARQASGSRIVSVLSREGRGWEESRLCRILTAAATFPGDLLHRWYEAWQATFDDSLFARFVFELGEGTAILESWVIMLLWVIPFIYWNNAWSLLVFAFLLLLFHAGAMRKKTFRLDIPDIGVYPVAFCFLMVLSAPLSYAPELSWRFLGYHLAAAVCLLVTLSAVRNVSDLKRLCAGGTFCVAVSSCYGVLQRIQGVKVNIAYVDAKLNPDMPGRVQSYFDNPNTFGEFLVMLLPLTLALALCSERKSGKIAAAGAFFVGVAALLMTYSRAGWVGFALSVGLMVLCLRPALLPALIALCVAAIPFLPSAVWTRILTITNFNDTTTSSRFPLYEAALELIRRAPLDGAGLGSDVVRKYIKDFLLYHGSAPFVHAHNLYLQVCIETGVIGLAAFVASIFATVKRGLRTARNAPAGPARIITCAAASGLCGIALCGMADYPWHYPRIQVVFWFLFAMTLAGVKVCRTEAA